MMSHDVVNIFIGVGTALGACVLSLFTWLTKTSMHISQVDSRSKEAAARHDAQLAALRESDRMHMERINAIWKEIQRSLDRIEDKVERKADK